MTKMRGNYLAGLGDGEGAGQSFLPPHPPHSARAVEMAKVAVASRTAVRARRRIEVFFMTGLDDFGVFLGIRLSFDR